MKNHLAVMALFLVLFSAISLAHPYPEHMYGNMRFTAPTGVITGGGGGGGMNPPIENITNITEEEPDILEKPVEEIFDEKMDEVKEWAAAQITGLASSFGIPPAMFPIFILCIIFLIFVLYEESKKRGKASTYEV